MDMEKVMKELKRDRKVDNAWIKRLEQSGFEVNTGTYSYWNNQEYVKIGHTVVWLVESRYSGNSQYVTFRFRNDVIDEIYETIKEEERKLKNLDEKEAEFFRNFPEKADI